MATAPLTCSNPPKLKLKLPFLNNSTYSPSRIPRNYKKLRHWQSLSPRMAINPNSYAEIGRRINNVKNTYNYSNKNYKRLDSCLVIPPPQGVKPKALIKFLGGAFIGAVPEVTYRYFRLYV